MGQKEKHELMRELTRRMGVAQEPDLKCLVDIFIKMVPPQTTSQMKGQRWTGKFIHNYTLKRVEEAKQKYYRRFFDYRLEQIPMDALLFARVYIYWPPPLRLLKTMDEKTIILKPTTNESSIRKFKRPGRVPQAFTLDSGK